MRCRLRYGPRIERESPRVLCLMTQRRLLDAFLVEQAVAAGVEFRDGIQATIDSETELRVDGKPVEVDALIGADGANGITARSLGLGGAIVNGVALEGNLSYEELPPSGWRGTLVLELSAVPGGYGWIFPKATTSTSASAAGAAKVRNCAVHLRVLCDLYGIELRRLTDLRGHRLPMRQPGTVLARGRALVIGDAAGPSILCRATASTSARHRPARFGAHARAPRRRRRDPRALRVGGPAGLDPLASAGWSARSRSTGTARGFRAPATPGHVAGDREAPAGRGLPPR
jgi:flavin-dependent dehydrogenase